MKRLALTIPPLVAAPSLSRRERDERRSRERVRAIAIAPLLALAACTATQQPDAVAPSAPGFLLGLWHGLIFPLAWIASLFVPGIAVYAVPNNGGWYDFGYFLGIVVFGVGAKRSHTVYRDRVVRVRD